MSARRVAQRCLKTRLNSSLWLRIRLVGQRTNRLGTLVLLAGYLFQAGALDRGRLSVIQPLLVSTVVFALPLGYLLTSQQVGRREVSGAVAIVIGLSLFVYFGDPRLGGTRTRPTRSGRSRSASSRCSVSWCSSSAAADPRGRRPCTAPSLESCSGSHRPSRCRRWTISTESVGTMLSHWECYALAVIGLLGFAMQQVSLGTGRLAPAVATVSVANPVVAILIGIVLLDERLSRPAWHVPRRRDRSRPDIVGAIVISLAREAPPTPVPGRELYSCALRSCLALSGAKHDLRRR